MNLPQKTVDSWKRGNSKTWANIMPQIADCFGVSIDYLWGRSTETNSIMGGVSGSAFVQCINNGSAVVGEEQLKPVSEEVTELMRIYNSLDVKRRVKLLEAAFSLEESRKEQ